MGTLQEEQIYQLKIEIGLQGLRNDIISTVEHKIAHLLAKTLPNSYKIVKQPMTYTYTSTVSAQSKSTNFLSSWVKDNPVLEKKLLHINRYNLVELATIEYILDNVDCLLNPDELSPSVFLQFNLFRAFHYVLGYDPSVVVFGKEWPEKEYSITKS